MNHGPNPVSHRLHAEIRHPRIPPGSAPAESEQQELSTDTRIVLELVRCAGLGWNPEDLRHQLGSGIQSYLAIALGHLIEHATPELLSHWINMTGPEDLQPPDEVHKASILRSLEQLENLEEWFLLSAVRDLRTPVTFPGHPTAQAQARHLVAAVLAKAPSTTFPSESEAPIRKAEFLRVHHRIGAVFGSGSPTARRTGSTERTIAHRFHLRAPWVRPQFRLLSVISRAHSCESQLLTTSGIASVIGDINDVACVQDLFASLCRQRDHFLSTAPGADLARRQRQTTVYRRNFLLAYATGIEVRLNQILDRPRTDSPTLISLPSVGDGDSCAADVPDSTDALRPPKFRPGHRDGQEAADRSCLDVAASVLPGSGQSAVEQVEHRPSA